MQKGCTGTALVFSGRRDPEWQVSAGAIDELRAIWAALAREAPPAAAPAPALGYRGCVLRCPPGEEWHAGGGAVTHVAASGARERRGDPERSFERLLLSTAPEGLLPPGLA